MFWQPLLWAVGVVAALLVGTFWSQVRGLVASWLREHGYQNSVLVDAWIQLDRLVTGIQSQIFLRVAKQPPVRASIKLVPLSEIDDPEVKAALASGSQVQRNILALVQ